jgi:hypothetical protein
VGVLPVDSLADQRGQQTVLSVTAGLTVTGATPASAGVPTDRICRDFYTGDHNRRLSVCAVMWFSDVNTQYRAVIQMHTYLFVVSGWADITSQSITINSASLNVVASGTGIVHNSFSFGNDPTPVTPGGTTCRIGGPSGAVGCSVPNAFRVDFYSTAGLTLGSNRRYVIQVDKVSWRDDRGQPHSPSGRSGLRTAQATDRGARF